MYQKEDLPAILKRFGARDMDAVELRELREGVRCPPKEIDLSI